MFARKPDARMNLANFMRTHLYASLATLKIGCDILFKEEKVKVDTLYVSMYNFGLQIPSSRQLLDLYRQ